MHAPNPTWTKKWVLFWRHKASLSKTHSRPGSFCKGNEWALFRVGSSFRRVHCTVSRYRVGFSSHTYCSWHVFPEWVMKISHLLNVERFSSTLKIQILQNEWKWNKWKIRRMKSNEAEQNRDPSSLPTAGWHRNSQWWNLYKLLNIAACFKDMEYIGTVRSYNSK